MKKIFTFATFSLLTLAVMAADHNPSVIVKSGNNFEIVVDGKHYAGNNYIDLAGLYPGFHSVKVYQVNKRFFFGKRNKLVSSAGFSLRNNNVMITVDRFGKIDIDEERFAYNNNDHNRDWNSHDAGKGRDHDENGFGKDRHQKGRDRQF